MELSKSQDVEAGDGTTSVVVLAGSLLDACMNLLNRGIHPSVVSDAFQIAADKAEEIMTSMSLKLDLKDRESLLKSAVTSLNSKVRLNHNPQYLLFHLYFHLYLFVALLF